MPASKPGNLPAAPREWNDPIATMIRSTKNASQRAPLLGGATLALALLSGCSGNLNASAKGSANSDGEADFDAEGDAAWDTVDASQSEAETSAGATPSTPQMASLGQSAEVALLGARRDLVPAQGAPQPCTCLAVAVGQPNSSHLVWTGVRPTTDPSVQTVIALTSDDVPCAEAGPGASYMGYVKENGDVIVTVEAAVAGRPVTHGAIIPKPDSGKQIYVQPHGKIPYGRGKNGEARCALGAGD